MADKPGLIKILGEAKDFDVVVDGYAGIEKDIRANKFRYREAWDGFLPPLNGEGEKQGWQMAYNPLVCMAPFYFNEAKKSLKDSDYFVYVINLGRDQRPHSAVEKEKTGIHKEDCPVCRNNIAKEIFIADFDGFHLTPNLYPYHNYSSLLVSKDPKPQDTPTVEDIEKFMRFSILTGQSVFYNTFHAGATIDHQHAQVVDPEEIKSKGQQIDYPILRAPREKIARGIERVVDYAVDSVAFEGRDAPIRAYDLYKNLLRKGHKYNFFISGRTVFVFGRNPDKETSPCIGKCVGTYELMGIIQLGNLYEKKSKEGDARLITDATELFRSIPPERIAENLDYASVSLEAFLRQYLRSK